MHLAAALVGHQLPIWYCPDGHATVRVDPPTACAECGSTELERESDVLDTWFSSALWPRDARLARRDAGARPLLPGQRELDSARDHPSLGEQDDLDRLELLGDVPFTDVIIHSTVLAIDGRRMSKSLGTGIDPMEPIEEHGADATRYGLLKISSTQDVRFSYGAIEEGRKLAIKLWNVARLILQNAKGVTRPWRRATSRSAGFSPGSTRRGSSSRTRGALRLRGLDGHALPPDLRRLLRLVRGGDQAAALRRRPGRVGTALAALERLLALLHPVMPHVTEEIWSQLPERETRLIVAPWPEADGRFADAAGALDRVQEAAQIFRRSGVQVELGSDDERRIFAAVVRPDRARADGNRDAEIERLRKEVARAEGMLANERFVANAPANVVAAEREKLERYRRELVALGG